MKKINDKSIESFVLTKDYKYSIFAAKNSGGSKILHDNIFELNKAKKLVQKEIENNEYNYISISLTDIKNYKAKDIEYWDSKEGYVSKYSSEEVINEWEEKSEYEEEWENER